MSKQSSNQSGESVAELNDALEALPDGAADAGSEAPDDNPLEHVDVSGTTSFESAEFAAEYEGGEAEEEEPRDEDDDVVIVGADAEDGAEELARRLAEAKPAGEASDEDIAPGGRPRELAELMSVCEALIFVSDEPLPVKALADLLTEERGWVQVAVESLARE